MCNQATYYIIAALGPVVIVDTHTLGNNHAEVFDIEIGHVGDRFGIFCKL